MKITILIIAFFVFSFREQGYENTHDILFFGMSLAFWDKLGYLLLLFGFFGVEVLGVLGVIGGSWGLCGIYISMIFGDWECLRCFGGFWWYLFLCVMKISKISILRGME